MTSLLVPHSEKRLAVPSPPARPTPLVSGLLSERGVIATSRTAAVALAGPARLPLASAVKGAPAPRSESSLVHWLMFRVVETGRRFRVTL